MASVTATREAVEARVLSKLQELNIEMGATYTPAHLAKVTEIMEEKLSSRPITAPEYPDGAESKLSAASLKICERGFEEISSESELFQGLMTYYYYPLVFLSQQRIEKWMTFQ
jgi:hypothetical protein